MAFVLSRQQKQDISFLQNLETAVAREVMKAVINFLGEGENKKIYDNLKKTVNLETSEIEKGLKSLAFLFIEASKLKLNEIDFYQVILGLNFPEETNKLLKRVYNNTREGIRDKQSKLSYNLPHFVDLNWRFDIQISNRSSRDLIEPLFFTKFESGR